MIIFALKKWELKEKTQDANFSIPIKNPESAIKNWIPDPDSKIGPKIGRIPDPGFGFRIARQCQPYFFVNSWVIINFRE